jgi:hypothetical protein
LTRALGTHDRQHSAHHMHEAEHVGCELVLDSTRGYFFKVAHQAIAGVVDQNVDAAELLHCGLNGRFGLRLVGYVQFDKGNLVGGHALRARTQLFDVSTGCNDLVAGLQCGLGDLGSDAAT